jgi:hypothetical protein
LVVIIILERATKYAKSWAKKSPRMSKCRLVPRDVPTGGGIKVMARAIMAAVMVMVRGGKGITIQAVITPITDCKSEKF